MPKTVDPFRLLQKVRMWLSLLRRKAWNFIFACNIINIDIVMCHVEVANQNNLFCEWQQVGLKIPIPLLHTILESFQTLASIWHIHCHQEEAVKLHSDRASLLIVRGTALEVMLDTERLDFGENRCATVALFDFWTIPVLHVARWYLFCECLLNLGLVTFCFV